MTAADFFAFSGLADFVVSSSYKHVSIPEENKGSQTDVIDVEEYVLCRLGALCQADSLLLADLHSINEVQGVSALRIS